MSGSRQVAFVRNIMVGRRGLTREVLLDIFRAAGARDTRSYISTGNFAFTATPSALLEISARIEAGIDKVLGHREEVFLRSVKELSRLHEGRFFGGYGAGSEHYRAATFLPAAARWTEELPYATPRNDVEVLAASGPNVFAIVRRVEGGAGSPHSLVERLLKVRATTRNWNTVERILHAEG